MTKNTLILTFYLFLGLIPMVSAQNTPLALEWQKCFGGSRVENIVSMTPTTDGGYIFLGSSSSIDGDLINASNTNIYAGRKYWIAKVSSSNTIEWQRLLGGNRYDTGTAIIQAADGGYLAVGSATSYDGDVLGSHNAPLNNKGDAWVLKLSASGIIEWQKCYGGTGYDDIKSIAKTKDGGYILAGTTNSNDGDVSGNQGVGDGWVIKISALGRLEWQKTLGGSNSEGLVSILQTKEGGYIATGYTYSNDGDIRGSHGNSEAWVVKLSNLGALEWQKCFGGTDTDLFNSVILTNDGGYALTGKSHSYDGDVSGNHNSSADAWVVKIAALGNIQWQKCIGGSDDDNGNTLLQMSDGSYMMAGSTSSDDGDVTPHNFGANPSEDAWVVKLSNQGALLWQRPLGGWHPEKFYAMKPTLDGGYLLAGTTFSDNRDVSGNHGGMASDGWIVKLTADTKAIMGKIEQTNTFCQTLTPPQYVTNAKVKIAKDNTAAYYTSVDSLGRFNVIADTGRFAISAVPPNQLWTACPPQIVTLSNQKIRDTANVNPNLFINAICPLMEVQLTTPRLRRCFENTYTIDYANRGTAMQNDATAELTLDSMLSFVSATRPVRSRVGNKITFSLGNIGINQVGQFTVNILVSCNSGLGQTHCSSVIIPKTMTCDVVQDSIPTIITQCVSGCDSVVFLINRPNSTANKTFKYQLMADATLIDTGRFVLTNTYKLKHKTDGRTYRLEIRNPTTNQLLIAQAIENPPSISTPSVSTGFVNQFAQSIKQANIAENCTENRGAFDPNDKSAIPKGIGVAHLIEQGKQIDYLVQFQNTGTDTAFTVVVKDTLAAQFDVASFKWEAQSHGNTWQLNHIGVLTVTFNNINLVDSFTNEKGSHGFFRYTIKLKDSIITNTIINNKAAIYFDFNAPIITNLTTHTIGKEVVKSCLMKPSITVNYTGCPSRNIVFNALGNSAGLTPTYEWYRNNETRPFSTNARFTLANASNGTKFYCKIRASDDMCTETPVVTSDTIVLNCIGVSTNETSIIPSFDVYPNPSKGLFTIKLTASKPTKMALSILNYLGQTIKTELINTENYSNQFNLSDLPKGIYLIKLTLDGRSIVKKVSIL
jgi:uncharacterized repeat protein (TIGR01451 family)